VFPPIPQRRAAINRIPGKGKLPESAVVRAMRTQSEGAFDPLRDDAMVRSLQAAAKADPGNALVHLKLAQRYGGYGLFDQAMDEYASLLKIASPSMNSSEAETVTTAALSGVARTGFQAGRAGEAVSILASHYVRAGASNNADLHMYMGLLYARLGDQLKAEESFRAAVHADPHSASAHNNLGYQLMKRGLLAAAETQFREAIATSNASRAARNNLGLLLTQRGELESAWDQFAAADPDKAAARNNFAVALMNSGKLVESSEQLALSLREHLGYAPALQNFQLVQARIKERSQEQPNSAAQQMETNASASLMTKVP
jgi:Tfp pilus assembly protein PilF